MTIREALAKQLEGNGLWPDEATTVVSAFTADGVNESMDGRWDEDTSAYPPQLLAVLSVGVIDAAIAWLTANKPKHFALMMLTGGQPETP